VPLFLDQRVAALRSGGAKLNPEITKSAVLHGHDLLRQGFTVSQVVHDYGDVCQAITELAMEKNAPIAAEDFRTLNGCLDDAIASAVTEYGRARDQTTVDNHKATETERLGFFAHELRSLTNTSLIAFEVLRTGNVGVEGSTGTVLRRSLLRTVALIERSLAEVRLTEGIQNQEPFLVAPFIEELTAAANLEADAKAITFVIEPVAPQAGIEADRQVLGAVLSNLLQNAFKFTKPRTTVTLRVRVSADRVLIEVQDQCGGLPVADPEELFRPFEQRATDRTGLGLGLAFSRWGVEANKGRLYVRNLPKNGCVFTVDLPRVEVAAAVGRA
jgi:signal transduction histidine kinase